MKVNPNQSSIQNSHDHIKHHHAQESKEGRHKAGGDSYGKQATGSSASATPLPGGAGLPGGEESSSPSAAGAKTVPVVPIKRTVNVSNDAELKAALSNAQPGDNIKLAAGTYHGPVTLSGKTGVSLSGSKDAVIETSSKNVPSFKVDGCNQCSISGISIKGGQKGLMVTKTQNSVFDNLDVSNTQMEGVHFKENSSGNTLQGSSVHDTGLGGDTPAGHGRTQADDGEGVYVGTAKSNNAQGDASNNNSILNNKIYNNTAENIDIKEFTHGGVIAGNTLDGSGSGRGATANVALKGSGYQVHGNTVSHPVGGGIRSFPVDGVPNSGKDNQVDG